MLLSDLRRGDAVKGFPKNFAPLWPRGMARLGEVRCPCAFSDSFAWLPSQRGSVFEWLRPQKEQFAGLFRCPRDGDNIRSLVRAIAERLLFGLATGAPMSGRRRRPLKGSPPSAAQTERGVFPHSALMDGPHEIRRKGIVRRGEPLT